LSQVAKGITFTEAVAQFTGNYQLLFKEINGSLCIT